MTISAGSDIVAADFVTTSAGAGDSGKVPKLNASGVIDRSMSQLAIETSTTASGTATQAITTLASQKIIVWAKGHLDSNNNGRTVTLGYNGVSKDTVVMDGGLSGSNRIPFALMYTETPGATTHDITVTSSVGTLTNVVIIVLKI